MEAHIDLDAAAVEIERRVDGWRAAGLQVAATTWRDSQASPPVITPDRTRLLEPDSIGVRLSSGQAEGSMVLFRGGWADLVSWSGRICDDVVVEAPGWGNPLSVEAFATLLDALAARLQLDGGADGAIPVQK